MLRFRLRELVADFEFREKRRLTTEEISEKTGIHRTTISKIARRQGYNTTTDNLDRLCAFFGCAIENLVTYVPADVLTKKKTTKRKSST